MAEELFQNIRQGLTFDSGVVKFGPARMIMVTAGWVTDLQKGLEDLVGSDGAFALINTAGRTSGEIEGQLFNQLYPSLSFDQKVGVLFQFLEARGWGSFEIVNLTMDPFNLVVKYTNPYHEGTYNGDADGTRCFYQSGVAAAIEQFAIAANMDLKLVSEETKCVAKGDSHCELTYKPE
jgi:hypothetical protein